MGTKENSIDTAVFTTKFVLEDKRTITYVTHDVEDGSWQFFSDDKFDNFDSVARVVGLREIVDIDPSLTELMDMDVGHVATRKSKDDRWIVSRAE